MSEFLEQLKVRLAEAQQRHQLTGQKLQQAQQEHALATQDYSSWQNAVRVESQREQNQPQRELQMHQPQAPADTATVAASAQLPIQQEETINKTDAVRQILQQHPEGLRPTDLWKQLGAQLKHRAYLYSVLKRLRDKSEVTERRGKYFLKIVQKLETEEKTHALVQ